MKLTSHQHTKFEKKIKEEFRSYITYFILLTVIFFVFNFYQQLILSKYHISSFHYGYSIVEALILAKVILIGQAMNLGNQYENKPLIIPVFYKTLVFSLLFFILELLEHLILAMIDKENIRDSLLMLFSPQHILAIAIKVFIISWVFILVFSFLELSNVLGKGTLVKLFFKPKMDRYV